MDVASDPSFRAESVVNTPHITNNTGSRNHLARLEPPLKTSIDGNQDEQGPDYKQQCHSIIPSLHAQCNIDEVPTEHQLRPSIRCSNSSSSSSSAPMNRSYIPLVCGVPLSDEDNVTDTFDPHTVQYHAATATRTTTTPTITNRNVYHNNRDSEAPGDPTSLEQAPVPQIVSVQREVFDKKQSTSSLSNSEKRYWIKVVVIAVIVNTLLVLGVVMGGVCGSTGCDFSRSETAPALGNDMYRGNATDSPTPAPSRRLVASESPVWVSVEGPNAPYNDSDESLYYPSWSPVFSVPPTMISGEKDGPAMPTSSTAGIQLMVILPIAIIVDAMLIVGYLYFHYSRWIRRRNKV